MVALVSYPWADNGWAIAARCRLQAADHPLRLWRRRELECPHDPVLVRHRDLYRDLLEEAWRTADSRREVVIAAILSAMKRKEDPER